MRNTCSCENVERMLEDMAARRDEMPEDIRQYYDLFVASAGDECRPCCTMVLWFYYAFFCENTHSVSEEARHILMPLMEGRWVGDQEEREWAESGSAGR